MKFGKPGEGKFNILRNTRYINLLNMNCFHVWAPFNCYWRGNSMVTFRERERKRERRERWKLLSYVLTSLPEC